jgi:hypothetical protein
MVSRAPQRRLNPVLAPNPGWAAAPLWLHLTLWLMANAWPLMPLEASGQTTTSQEYHVKAAFLFNFAQFVQWPTNAFAEAKAPLVIGVIGEDPFGAVLDEIVRGESVNGHPLLVQRYRRAAEIKACHILFINEPDRKRLEETLTLTKGASILTVGETGEFTRLGGMVQFFTESGKIRFQINVETTQRSNLEVSSRLLRLARLTPTTK